MLEPDLLQLFVKPLNEAGARYLVSGSIAAMLYGEPRVTHDIDLVVALSRKHIEQLPLIFPPPEFYVPPLPVILSAEAGRGGSFNIIHADSGLKADLYFTGRDELHAWAFRNTRQYSVGDIT